MAASPAPTVIRRAASVAAAFLEFLRSLPGVDWVIAGKLGARKRPKLMPVLDSVTMPTLSAPAGNVWAMLRSSLSDEERRERIGGCVGHRVLRSCEV
ncbi:MAG: DUF6308 family protein, partial [Actinobacteria bacterium]|nr:DUF6308 family protein [Actinomycetota bacterium]